MQCEGLHPIQFCSVRLVSFNWQEDSLFVSGTAILFFDGHVTTGLLVHRVLLLCLTKLQAWFIVCIPMSQEEESD